jgi:hypothetical protein
MKTAMVDASSFPRRVVVHPLEGMGEIADGALCYEQGGFVTVEILHIDSGQSAGHGVHQRPSQARSRKRRSFHAF